MKSGQDGKVFPWLVCYVDASRGVCLVRGKRAVVEWALDKLGVHHTWSRQFWGAVAPASVANDLPALAKLNHEFVVVTPKAPAPR